ncbi:MAG TPA: hypothetical protein VKB05_01635 [Pyrinomonadaceae bacterium]|nr:hypothetical protein [Pyrinomonadaceae bacterium]
MKTLPLGLLLLIGLAGSFQAQQSNYQKDQIRRARIKRITSVVSTKQKFVSDYDQRGNLVRRVGYGSDGSAILQESFKYDDKDNVIEAVIGGEKRTYSYRYSSKGQAMEARLFDSEGRLRERTEYVVDEAGRVVQSLFYRGADGNVVERHLHTYQSSDVLSQTLIQGPNGNLMSRITYEYEGDRLRRKSIYGPNGNLLRQSVYKRDQKGLVVEELGIDEKGQPLDRTMSEYEFYS